MKRVNYSKYYWDTKTNKLIKFDKKRSKSSLRPFKEYYILKEYLPQYWNGGKHAYGTYIKESEVRNGRFRLATKIEILLFEK